MIKSDLLPKEKQEKAINEIIRFFEEEKDEKIGIIAAEKFLEFILKNIGSEIYNKAIDDSKILLQTKLEEMDFHYEELKK